MTKEEIMKKCKSKKEEINAVYRGECKNCDEVKSCETYQYMHFYVCDEPDKPDELDESDLNEIDLLDDWD